MGNKEIEPFLSYSAVGLVKGEQRHSRMTQEQKFFNALRDVFVGAKVEGESGSIYFARTRYHDQIYERVYTDDRDVMLFWKTHMLYYVKTDRLFQSMEVEVDGQKFFFDVSSLEHKKANEKRDIVYSFTQRRKDGTLAFEVAYSERGRKTNMDDILRTLRGQGTAVKEETLERAFRVFEKQSEVDYFINKDAKAFLEEQFDLWMYQYVFKGESRWTEARIKQLQTLREIAFKIIAFISQFESELVKVWNKPKFVLNSNYVITLDRIASPVIASQIPEQSEGATKQSLIEKILNHPNFNTQVEEWRQLGIVDSSFDPSVILTLSNSEGEESLNPKYRYLPIDTKHFKDLEPEILGLFDNLDEALDGWLIKSENYQALNTILPKFREKVKVIYIDPPYNTGNDEFIYKDKYQHSSWLTMMENRLRLARDLLSGDGAIFTHIDENEQPRLYALFEGIFGEENYIAPLIWISRAGKGGTATKIQIGHEHVESAAKQITKLVLKPVERVIEDCPYKDEKGYYKRELLRQWGSQHDRREDRPTLYFPIPTPFEIKVYPKRPDGADGTWRFSQEKVMKMLAEGDLDFIRDKETDEITVYRKIRAGQKVVSVPSNLLDNVGSSADGTKMVQALFGHKVFDTAKPVPLADRLVELVSWQSPHNDLILDFFAGSGTTAHAVINLNRQYGGKRKYILVEMADYFETVMMSRIKKVVFSDRWKDGKAQEGGQGISHFVKYYELEQYEDTLRKAKYKDSDLFDNPYQDPHHQYVFLRDLKMLEALELDLKKNTVKVDLSRLYDGIDLAETLSNLTGKGIKRIRPDSVEFEDGEVVEMQNLDWKRIKPLIWW